MTEAYDGPERRQADRRRQDNMSDDPDMRELRHLVYEQTVTISALGRATENLAGAMEHRPTRRSVIAIIVVIVLLSNLITNGFTYMMFDSLQGIAEGNRELNTSNRDLLRQIEDCQDNTTDDGDPIGECAAISNARFAAAVAQLTVNLSCEQDKFFRQIVALNPDLGVALPPPREDCPEA